MKKMFLLGLIALTSVFTACQQDEIDDLNGDIADLELYNRGFRNEVIKLEGELATSDAALVAAQGSVTMLENVVAGALARISGLDATVAADAITIAALDITIAAAEARIIVLEGLLEEATARIGGLQTVLADLLANPITIIEYVEVVTEVVETVIEIQTVTVTVPGPGNTETITVEVPADTSALDAQIADLLEQVAALEIVIPEDGVTQDQVDAVQALLTQSEAALVIALDNSVDEATIASLNEMIANLNAANTDLQASLDAANLEINQLNDVDVWILGTSSDAPGAFTYAGDITEAIWNLGSQDNGGAGTVVAFRSQTVTTTTAYVLDYDGATDVDQPADEVTSEVITETKDITDSFVAPPVDADNDGFTDDVDLDDGDATVGDAAAEAAKAEQARLDEEARLAGVESDRLAAGLAAAPFTPAFGTQIAGFTQTKSFETVSDSRDITVTPSPLAATVTNEAGTTYTFSHGGGSHDVPGAAIVAGDPKDLDGNGVVDYADAVAAGYSVVSVGGSPGGWNIEYSADAISTLGLSNTLVSNQTIGQYNQSFDTVTAVVAQTYAEDQIVDAYILL